MTTIKLTKMDFKIPVLAPSILAADFLKLGEQVEACLDEGVEWIHCDIMDGHFVPNISYGPGIVDAVGSISDDLFLDVHLMIENPDQYIEAFSDAGADLISVHFEACPHLHRTIQHIRNYGCMTGVAINPSTPVSQLEEILPEVDLVLVMSVNPGFGGQTFIDATFKKVEKLKEIKEVNDFSYLIEVDGGVGTENAAKLVESGTDVLVAGSSVFKNGDITKNIQKLISEAEN